MSATEARAYRPQLLRDMPAPEEGEPADPPDDERSRAAKAPNRG